MSFPDVNSNVNDLVRAAMVAIINSGGISGGTGSSGDVTVDVAFPLVQTVSFLTGIAVTNLPSGQTVTWTGQSLSVTNLPSAQTVSWSAQSVSVSNLPAAQTVSISGTPSVSVTNLPAAQTVSLAATTVSLAAQISTANSTSTPLANSATFTGTSESGLLYNSVSVMVSSSHDSATDGLVVEQSQDGTNWDTGDYTDVFGGEPLVFNVNLVGEFFRVSYTNSGTTQTTFRLETKKNAPRFDNNFGRSSARSKFALLAATNTVDTALIAAPGTSKSILVRSVEATNETATLARLALKDGSTKFHEMAIAASGGGYVKNFILGKKITKNTAFNVALSATGVTIYTNCEYVIIK